jgi:hypothetical protein
MSGLVIVDQKALKFLHREEKREAGRVGVGERVLDLTMVLTPGNDEHLHEGWTQDNKNISMGPLG